MLPEVKDCAAEFGEAAAEHLGVAIPIRGIAGDQQAALIGQACFRPGMVKSTYGTGCFALVNTGDKAIESTHKLLTTIGYQFRGKRTYALEGSIFSAGATVQWLRDGLGILASAPEAGELAATADPRQEVYLVPAFTGLGAPHWDSEARAAIFGLTRGATRKEIVRAALESVGYQTRDLIDAMRADCEGLWEGEFASVIRVDGGMSASDWTMQFLADMMDAQVDRPEIFETTALALAISQAGRRASTPSPMSSRRPGGGRRASRRRWRQRTRGPLSRLARGRRAHRPAAGDLEFMRIVFRCDPAIENELMRPVPARAALPDWLRTMPRIAFSELHGQEVRTVKQCPPFVDAMSHGFIIPLPCDVTVRDGVLSWDWDHPALTVEAHPRSPVSFHVPAQVTGTPFFDPEVAIVKFNSFWTIELEPGYSLFATHPVNRADLPFRLLTGVVDCDRFTDVGILFPAVWADPNFEGVLPRGTPSRSASRFCARRSSCNSSLSRRKKRNAISRQQRRCFRIPAPIGADFACGASAQASSRRRSRAGLSHRRPLLADVSAWAMRPKVSGRSRIARRYKSIAASRSPEF